MKSNKRLIQIVVALILVFALTQVFKGNNKSSELEDFKVPFDLTNSDSFQIQPKKGKGDLLKFSKRADKWYVKEGDVEYLANDRPEKILKSVKYLKVDRVVAKKVSSWTKYQVDDSLGTQLTFNNQGDYWKVNVGKVSYTNSFQNPVTFMRDVRSDLTFAVKSQVGSYVKSGLNGYRFSELIPQFQRDSIDKIIVSDGKNDLYSLEKKDSLWFCDGKEINNELIVDYLKVFRKTSGKKHVRETKSDSLEMILTPYVGEKELVVLRLSNIKGKKVISSNLLETNYYADQELIEKVFRDKEYFTN